MRTAGPRSRVRQRGFGESWHGLRARSKVCTLIPPVISVEFTFSSIAIDTTIAKFQADAAKAFDCKELQLHRVSCLGHIGSEGILG